MAVFYDPKDEQDQRWVEEVLRGGGIEYFLRQEPEGGLGPQQVHVAEEDIPAAEALLLRERTRH